MNFFIFIYYRWQFKKNHYPNQVNQIPFRQTTVLIIVTDTDRSLGSHRHWNRLCAAVVQEPESLHVWKVSNERLSTRCSPGIRFLRPPVPAPAVTILKRMSCLFLSRCSCCSYWIRFQPSLHSQQSPVGFQCVTYHHSLLCWVRGHCYVTCSFTFPQMVTWRAGENQQKSWPQPRPRRFILVISCRKGI